MLSVEVPHGNQRPWPASLGHSAKAGLRIVCEASLARDLQRVEREWRAIKLAGPFAFDQVGILSSVLDPLARANIGIFAVSTFDTDYILVKAQNLRAAIDALEAHGHRRLP